MIEALPLFMIVTLMIFLFSGFPVALVLIGVTMVFATIAISVDAMTLTMVQLFYLRTYSVLADNLIFPAVPPLIFMGVALSTSGLVGLLMKTLSNSLCAVPGGLSVTILLVGVLIAPTTGLVGAAVGVLALAALPTLLQHQYRHSVATACVAASGTLGVILPPAIMLFFLADLVGAPILGMFTGVLLPAAILLTLYIAYFVWCGNGNQQSQSSENAVGTKRSITAVVGPVAVIGCVLVPIATGFATPSQAGSLGAAAAVLLMAFTSTLSWARLKHILIETAYVTAMVFFVIIAANAFSFIFRVLDGDQMISKFLIYLGLGNWGQLIFILGVIFVLGFFIDWLEIVLITLPIFVPILEKLDFTEHVGTPTLFKVWIGTAIALVLQTSFLTPPFGFALFFLRGAAPPEVGMSSIYRGIVPIVAIQVLVIGVVLLVPWLATSLPSNVID